ncbi:MAG: hypothetical protein E7068_06655 [Lentimicrobiaceae bacterium]|nr:hypothetical protein [Lentimicrobiaceae bacterium]MBQ4548018.1 hypothetical protein [Bacteroidales bacterium]
MKTKLFLFFVILCTLFVSCKPELEKPTIVTKFADNITNNSVTCGGEIISDGGADVTSRGFCLNISENPTFSNGFTVGCGTGLGNYEYEFTDLRENTRYYVRAYAANSEGISYGNELSFLTDINVILPIVTTLQVTEITPFTANCGGEISIEENSEIISRGVCWSTNPEPTINDNRTFDGNGNGRFVSELTDLEENTDYYVRAYAISKSRLNDNSDTLVSTIYGEVMNFKTQILSIDYAVPNEIYELVSLYFPIYDGVNPPNIEGEYVSSPHVLIYESYAENPETIQYHSDRYLGFQYTNNQMNFYGKQSDLEEIRYGVKITGEDDHFTCYYIDDGYPGGYYAQQSFIFSGKKTNEGLEDFHGAVILLETSGNPELFDKHSFRVFKDEDGLAENNNWMLIRSDINRHSDDDLFRMWLK